jgi:hypothetical protein
MEASRPAHSQSQPQSQPNPNQGALVADSSKRQPNADGAVGEEPVEGEEELLEGEELEEDEEEEELEDDDDDDFEK